MNGRVASTLLAIVVVSIPSAIGAQGRPVRKRVAENRPSPAASMWLVKPALAGPLEGKDRQARDKVLKVIEQTQTESFRQDYQVSVPARPTGLSGEYDFRVFAVQKNAGLIRIDIHVRGDVASGEMTTARGVYRAEMPAQDLDFKVRQAIYFLGTKVTCTREAEDDDDTQSLKDSTDEMQLHLEILSRDLRHPLHLRTLDGQIPDHFPATIDGPDDLAGQALGDFADATGMGNEEIWQLQAPTDAMKRALLARLRQLKAPRMARPVLLAEEDEESTDVHSNSANDSDVPNDQLALDDPRRSDLTAIQAQLDTRLAVAWRMSESLPELMRLKLDAAAARLAIVTSKNVPAGLRDALFDMDERMALWALRNIGQLPAAEQGQIYIDALPLLPDGKRVGQVLDHMRKKRVPLKPAQIAAVERFFLETTDRGSKFCTAAFLLDRTDSEFSFCYLRDITLTPWKRDQKEFGPLEEEAMTALFHHAVQKPPRRPATVAVVRELLKRHSGKDELWDVQNVLLECLILSDDPQDAELAEAYCRKPEMDTAAGAIHVLFHLRPEAAMQHVRRQLEAYLASNPSKTDTLFYQHVTPYDSMIFCRPDPETAALLKRAVAKEAQLPGRDLQDFKMDVIALINAMANSLDAPTLDERMERAKIASQRQVVRYSGFWKVEQYFAAQRRGDPLLFSDYLPWMCVTCDTEQVSAEIEDLEQVLFAEAW